MSGKGWISMDDDFARRATSTVIDLARTISRIEVAGHQDPISAGFDSIAVIELATRLEEELGVVCSIEDVFDAPSFDALAQELACRFGG